MFKNLKTWTAVAVVLCSTTQATYAQCPTPSTQNITTIPDNCQQALNLLPYLNTAKTLCINNSTATTSSTINDVSCTGTPAKDIWGYAENPYANVANYDGSLVFRWVNWPGKTSGVLSPKLAAHVDIAGSALGGLVSLNINCQSANTGSTNLIDSENAICVEAGVEGNQFYAMPGTIPTLAQLDPIIDAQAGMDVDVTNIGFWFQMVTSNGAGGDVCFEVSSYKKGYICGDANLITLSGTPNQVTGTATGCLSSCALYGGLANVNNNLPIPCGVESPASMWYRIEAPFTCNKVTISVPTWGGSNDYNVALVSNVNCPGATVFSDITQTSIFTPGQTLDPGAVVVASACDQSAVTANSVPAGTYYVYISGRTERPTFTLNVKIDNGQASPGTASSAQNGGKICSAGQMTVSTTGAVLPQAPTQKVAWFYSTTPNFNPYNNQGTYVGSGSSNVSFNLPANTTCAPVTYYVKGVISDNGTTAVASCQAMTSNLSVEVYPEIGNITVSNQFCQITVAARCPSFTVNGTQTSVTEVFTFADDGTSQNFVVSNGLAACNQVVSQTVSCSGNCTPPTATASAVCDTNDPYNFYVSVNFTPGGASNYTIVASDGSIRPISAAGTYTVGPFSNSSNISLQITNTEDTNCNVPLGSFTKNCNPLNCPNLTSATVSASGNVCKGDIVFLQAQVSGGVLNTDYTLQWYVNNQAIPNANTLNYPYALQTSQGCAAEVQNFKVKLVCLMDDAAPSTTTELSVNNALTVYPQPQFGVDFFPDPANCKVKPKTTTACNGLVIQYSPATDLTPGQSNATVNYTAYVQGAPTSCRVTGSYVVQCPSCTNSAGTGTTPTDNVICAGQNFNIGTTGASVGSGYVIGYATTTNNPYGNLVTAVNDAIAGVNGDVIGPYTTTATPAFTNGVQYGPGTTYFVPFVSLDLAAGQVLYQTSGTLQADAPFSGASATITIPTILYCQGITDYTMTLRIDQLSNEGNLNAIDQVTSPIFPGLSAATNDYNNTITYTGNPSGTTHTIDVSGNLFWGSAVNYTLTVKVKTARPFPTICPSCNDVGNPAVFNLLPEIALTPKAVPTLCTGESIDLTTLNPTANVNGTYTWHNTLNGAALTNTTVTPTNNQTYYVWFAAADDPTCKESLAVQMSVVSPPTLNNISNPAPICQGTAVNLHTFESSLVSNPSGYEFDWYRGDPANGGVRLTNAIAGNQIPSDGASYCCVVSSVNTGCSSKKCITFTVKPLPTLTAPIINPKVCAGSTFDLTSLQSGFTTQAGSFVWYTGTPSTSNQITTPQSITPVANQSYCAVFTASATGCSNQICITIDVNPLPTFSTVANPAPLCAGTSFDLTTINSQLTSAPGTFDWYTGNPTNGGTVVSNPTNIIPTNNSQYCVVFTDAITGCRRMKCFTFTTKAVPVLNAFTPAPLCAGTSVSLADYEDDLGVTGGLIVVWYKGNPANGGIALTNTQANNQTPVNGDTYCAVVTNLTTTCSVQQCITFTVKALPTLNSIPTQAPLCSGSSVDLTALQAGITTQQGSFAWYQGNPTTGTLVTTPAAVTPANNTQYCALFTNANGCKATTCVTYTVYTPVSGITASYDCDLDKIVVNFGNATGGSGSGYQVATNSPNQNGQSLPNGADWTILVTDGAGCSQTAIQGTVSCLVCAVGSAATSTSTICCGTEATFTVNNVTIASDAAIAWAITPQATGPVSSAADVADAAAQGMVIPANPDNSLSYTPACGTLDGAYYVTPFAVQSQDIVPLVYDTLNGCRPNASFCPNLIDQPGADTNWVLNPLIITFPNGETFNVNQKLAFGLPITRDLLNALGFSQLPCIDIVSQLYRGDPNGTWTFSATNTGTTSLGFAIPDFEFRVDAATCTQLNGVDQVVNIAGLSGIVQPGQTSAISLLVPPLPANFPTVLPNCEAYGTPVLINVDICQSTNDLLVSQLEVFPNPNDGSFTLQLEAIQANNLQIQVMNLLGQTVYQHNDTPRTGTYRHPIHLQNPAQGVYLIVVKADNQQITKRIVVR
jgi:hypothetical protein